MTGNGIRDRLSEAALYEQLAEEAAELAAAASKAARIMRGENPARCSLLHAKGKVVSEYSDVVLSAVEASVAASQEQIASKRRRWMDALDAWLG